MRIKTGIILFFLQIAIGFGITCLQTSSGYMDADYYYAGGIQISNGTGAFEPYIWNYLNDTKGLPNDSFTYWMPLASVIAALGMKILGNTDYFTARFFFILLSGFIPVITAYITWTFTEKNIFTWISGLIAIFAGFYTIYYSLTETFILYMLLCSSFMILFFIVLPKLKIEVFQIIIWGCIGVCAGLIHLCRADGTMWFFAALVLYIIWVNQKTHKSRVHLWLSGIVLIMSYLLIMSPWFFRNLTIFGSPFPAGGSRTLWLSNYDQIFSFPANKLTFQAWIANGFSGILVNIGKAFISNVKTLIAVQGMVFLIPLILLGVIKFRKKPIIVFGCTMWLTTMVVMTFIFPFAGLRGGFLHSGSASQPLFWAVATLGLNEFIEWGTKKRGWIRTEATKSFGVSMVVLAALFTAAVFYLRVINPTNDSFLWDQEHSAFSKVEKELILLGARPEDKVMTKNPPGYYVVNSRSGIVIPYGDISVLQNAATIYDIKYLLLDQDHITDLDNFYSGMEQSEHFVLLESVDSYQIYEIIK